MADNISLQDLNNILDIEEDPPAYQEERQDTNNSITENRQREKATDIAFFCFFFAIFIGLLVLA